MENLKDLSIFENSYLLPTFRMVDKPSFTKYKLENNPGVSYSFDYGYDRKIKELYIGTKVNDTIIQLNYWAPEGEEFDSYISTIEKITHSIKIFLECFAKNKICKTSL